MKFVWFGIICAIFGIIDAKYVHHWRQSFDMNIVYRKLEWEDRFHWRGQEMDDEQMRVWTQEIREDVQALCCDEVFKEEVDGYMEGLQKLPARQRKVFKDFGEALKTCKCEPNKPRGNQEPKVKAKCPPHTRFIKIEDEMQFKDVDHSSKYCYYYSWMRTSWPQAEFRCRQNGGHLASFHSEEEIKLVTSLSRLSFSETAWIGLNTRLDGRLKWSDGTKLNYLHYGIQTTGMGKGKCAEMSIIDYKWLESDCNEAKTYFCAVLKSEPK